MHVHVHVHCHRHVCAARVAYEASVHAYTRARPAHAPRTPLARPSQVAGVGLADHAKLDSVGVLTLVSMFAINLPAAVSVECQGDITPDFQNVIDAIPSEQAYPYPLPLPLPLPPPLPLPLTPPSRRATSPPRP